MPRASSLPVFDRPAGEQDNRGRDKGTGREGIEGTELRKAILPLELAHFHYKSNLWLENGQMVPLTVSLYASDRGNSTQLEEAAKEPPD